ncbi:MAG: hypothetical protein ACUVTM_04595 [Candidatus Bathyarchaeia archaeon]
MVKTENLHPKYSEEQIEEILDLQRDIIRNNVEFLKSEIRYFPFLSIAIAFLLGFLLGLVKAPRPKK